MSPSLTANMSDAVKLQFANMSVAPECAIRSLTGNTYISEKIST